MWDQFWAAAWQIGMPFILVCGIAAGFIRRWVVTISEYNDMKAAMKATCDAIKEESATQIAREREVGLEALRQERERYVELWEIVRPTIVVAKGALAKIEGRGR